MHKNIINCFAVIYIPFYALQCARQKRILEQFALEEKPLNQLSFDGLEPHRVRTENRCGIDDVSLDRFAALLEMDGEHVNE
jgi:hypothetical protein